MSIMQEFLTKNTVNCNLMSLTGYRTLVILSLLMEAPRSTDEINNYFLNNQYIRDKFSNDTLRIYINSLRAIGCQITDANKANKKYQLISHPFEYDVSKSQLKALSKLYKRIFDKIDIRKLLKIENLISKLADSTKSEATKLYLKNISVIKNVDKEILNDLIIHCKNNNQIAILYNSPRSSIKTIEIICDKLSFRFEKLYLWGNNLTHNEYSFLPVERIDRILSIKSLKDDNDIQPIRVVYELYNCTNYVPEHNEKIIAKTDDKLVIELNSKNEFNLMQRILYMTDNCKILEPDSFKEELLEKLKTMEQYYE